VVDRVEPARLRAYVVAAQGFATRFRRAGAADVEAAVRRLSCVQLDSIAAVARSHRLVLTSRVGAYPAGTVSRLLADGRLFEHWAHEASLLPIGDFPLFRRRMLARRVHHWRGPVIDRDPALRDEVLAVVRERGPVASRDFEGAGTGMWDWKPAKVMLEALWTAGELVVAGRRGFERLYDLPERVIPRALLDAPVPSEAEYLRGLCERAVRARGALTERGVMEHYRLRGRAERIRPHADALVAAGALRRLRMSDGGGDVLVPAEAALDAEPPAGAVLLSPFENLLWDRAFAARLFGFHHVIEVYKRPGERLYGYYVLPLLWNGRLVGRADVRSDRRGGTLRLVAFHREPGVRASAALDGALASALARLARVLGLDGVERAKAV
jgi:uncharacterized protein YcaQ